MMNFISSILIFFTFLMFEFNLLGKNERIPQGTYVVSANLINNKGILTKLINADSLFVYKHWVAEVKMKVKIVDMDGIEHSQKSISEGFYLINLQRNYFADVKDLKNLKDLTYKPLSEKKTGFDFGGGAGLFHNEAYTVENSIYDGNKARKISYTINGGPYDKKHITLYVTDVLNPSQPLILYPQMERLFKGSIKEMRIDLEDQIVLVMRCSYSQEIKKEYKQRLSTLSNILVQ